ncbi:geranylgeranyl transferase [Thraustotheca clavata]|uniref:Geranylgeranyl transferase type-1 subunit beta n=1 Tax=Thraustotheca clavata TaxID=74557 RepID=A0A1V9ZZW6_9STRA|nr:geranylgeranyl transferase [Thraustotheca clavata]
MEYRMNREAHVLYFLRNFRLLPTPFTGQDHHRVVLLFFCVHGLSVLGELDRIDRKQVIEWVYSLQIHPDRRDKTINCADCGFRGSSWLGNLFNMKPKEYESTSYDVAHIASTYASLAILRTLGDNFARVNKQAIVTALRSLQNPTTGGFMASSLGTEEDLRFVFCACAISYMLNDWSGVDRDGVVRYVNACATYEGGLGMNPGHEAQGGVTYCGIATLVLCGRLAQLAFPIQKLVHWLMFRQQNGFQGRTNKLPDSCYAFWSGATLQMLGYHNLVDIPSCRDFILSCQFPNGGGIAKFPDTYPDVMHAYYSLAWLSISGEDGLLPLETKLQVPVVKK